MTKRIEQTREVAQQPESREIRQAAPAWQRAFGWLGVVMAIPFFVWMPLALVAPVPSMVDVFGIVGLRIPASVTVGGLLLAAVGFHRF